MNLPAPLFIELLSDRQLAPCALILSPGGDDWSALPPFAPPDHLPDLARNLPCFLKEDGVSASSNSVLDALLHSGCQRIAPAGSFHRQDAAGRPELPATSSYLRGDWYLAPPRGASGSLASSRALALRLVQLVASEADTCEIEAVFRQDPVLAYHLLRLVNSLGVGVGRQVSSFSQAILILGRQQLKRWINLMLFAASRDDHRAAMLLARASVRARSVELLARTAGLERSVQEQAFMVGLFSLLGVLFGSPLAELIGKLNLNAATSSAVLHRERILGGMLNAVEFAETQNTLALREQLDALGLDITSFNQITVEAHHWMSDVLHDTQEKRHG